MSSEIVSLFLHSLAGCSYLHLWLTGSWSGLGRSAILEYSAFLLPFFSMISCYSPKTPFCPLNIFAIVNKNKLNINIQEKEKMFKKNFYCRFADNTRRVLYAVRSPFQRGNQEAVQNFFGQRMAQEFLCSGCTQ